MAQQQYRLVFRGKYIPGFTAEEAMGNLAKLFGVGVSRIETLLATLPATIKQRLDMEAGSRYLLAIAEAGMITHLEPSDTAWDGAERARSAVAAVMLPSSPTGASKAAAAATGKVRNHVVNGSTEPSLSNRLDTQHHSISSSQHPYYRVLIPSIGDVS